MSKALKIKALVLERIFDGTYPVGETVPSIRELATETRANVNTVVLAYRELAAAGIIKGERGRGTFVIRYPDSEDRPNVLHQLQRDLLRVVDRAFSAGVGPDELRRLFQDAVSLDSHSEPLRLLFVECNQYDALDVSSVLSATLGLRVEPVVLGELSTNAEKHLMMADVVITVPNHSDSVHQAVNEVTPVIVINSMPTTLTMVQLSRIATGKRVATLATNQTAALRLCDVVRVYSRDVEVTPFITDAIEDMEPLMQCDVIVHSHAVNEFVGMFCKKHHSITVRYEPEVNSLEFLKARLADLFPDQYDAPASGVWEDLVPS